MRISSWTIRGAGRKRFKHQAKDLLKIHNSDIIVLIEIKVSTYRAQQKLEA